MSNHTQMKSLNAKITTEMELFREKYSGSSTLCSATLKERQMNALQTKSLSPSQGEIPTINIFNEDFISIHNEAPENLPDSDEESKFCQNLELKIERMKESCKLEEFLPKLNKSPLQTPGLKGQEKIQQIHPYRHLIFNPDCSQDVLREHLKKVYTSLVYGVHYLKKPKEAKPKSGFALLAENIEKDQKTLFVELDETLIHSCSVCDNPDHIVKTGIFQGESAFGFNMRPYCMEFLKRVSKHYEVFVFTAASEDYANYIVDVLDPEFKYIKGILFKNHCLQTKKGITIKDLSFIKNREMKNMVIMDTKAHAFALQLDNGIPILEWKNDKNDRELEYILHYLLELAESCDVRVFNRKFLKLNELSNLEYKIIVNL